MEIRRPRGCRGAGHQARRRGSFCFARPVRHGLRSYARLTLLSLSNVATTTTTTTSTTDGLYDLGYRPMVANADGLFHNACHHVPYVQSECSAFGAAVVIPKVLLNDDRVVVNACGSDMNVIPNVLLNDACGSDVNATPTVLLNDDQFVVDACGLDTNAMPYCSFNGGRHVVGACWSDMTFISNVLVNHGVVCNV